MNYDDKNDNNHNDKYNKYNIVAIICARGGSKGVPKKNIRLLNGKPLIAYTIEAAKKSKYIDRVVVSTDDKEIQNIAIKYGAEAPFLRPKELATDSAPKDYALIHAVEFLESGWGKIDIVVDLDPTTPLRTTDDINRCIEKLTDNRKFDVVETVCIAHHNPYFNMLEKNEKTGAYEYCKKLEFEITRRQDAPVVYQENAGAVVIWRDTLIHDKSRFNGKIGIHIMPGERSIMIDTELEFLFVEFLMKNNKLKKDVEE